MKKDYDSTKIYRNTQKRVRHRLMTHPQSSGLLLLINNIGYAYHDKTHKPTKGIAIVPIDVNGNGKLDEEEKFYGTLDELMEAIAKGKYPAPPARNLYLVTAGKPKNPVVVEFLKYVRTKGQRLNAPAGFVHI